MPGSMVVSQVLPVLATMKPPADTMARVSQGPEDPLPPCSPALGAPEPGLQLLPSSSRCQAVDAPTSLLLGRGWAVAEEGRPGWRPRGTGQRCHPEQTHELRCTHALRCPVWFLSPVRRSEFLPLLVSVIKPRCTGSGSRDPSHRCWPRSWRAQGTARRNCSSVIHACAFG